MGPDPRRAGDGNMMFGAAGAFAQYGTPNTSYGNGKIYWQIGQKPFYGNQYVQPVQIGKALSVVGDLAGRSSFVVGTGLDGARYLQGDPTMPGSKFATNIGVGIYGLFGGPLGAGTAVIYGGVDFFFPGAWEAGGEAMFDSTVKIELNRQKYGYGPKY